MRFPSAAKGITKIFVSELLTLFSGFAMAIIIVIAKMNENSGNAQGVASGLLIGLGVAGAVFIVSFVIKVIGYIQAAGDEEGFTRAIIFAIVSVVLLGIANFLFSQSGDIMKWIYTIVLAASEITMLMVSISAVGGMVNLSCKCGNENLARRGSTILKIISAIFTLNIILIILNRVFVYFIPGTITVTISTIITAVIAVLSVIQYILYISYLSSVSSMLKES